MTTWKVAVDTKTAALIAKGYRPALASKCALKACRHLHLAHKAAMNRRVSMADEASKVTGTFHAM